MVNFPALRIGFALNIIYPLTIATQTLLGNGCCVHVETVGVDLMLPWGLVLTR